MGANFILFRFGAHEVKFDLNSGDFFDESNLFKGKNIPIDLKRILQHSKPFMNLLNTLKIAPNQSVATDEQ